MDRLLEPNGGQGEDFFGAAWTLDGQLHLVIRQPWNKDGHLKEALTAADEWISSHNICVNASKAPTRTQVLNTI